jgi:hypothetical protein
MSQCTTSTIKINDKTKNNKKVDAIQSKLLHYLVKFIIHTILTHMGGKTA